MHQLNDGLNKCLIIKKELRNQYSFFIYKLKL